jgi:hypothetical protein
MGEIARAALCHKAERGTLPDLKFNLHSNYEVVGLGLPHAECRHDAQTNDKHDAFYDSHSSPPFTRVIAGSILSVRLLCALFM